jgi:four helix bundle protein
MQNYEELKVWMKGHLFTLKIYEASKHFPKEEFYGLTNQLRQAGRGKNSQNELAHFLNSTWIGK